MLSKLHGVGCSQHSCPWTSSTNVWLNCPPLCRTHYHYWSLHGYFICIYLCSLPQLTSAYKQPLCLNKQTVSHIVFKHVFLFLFSSVAQSCPTLCNLMNRSTPGLPVHHQLWSSLKLMSIELVMPSSHLILRHPLLLLPPNTFFKFMQIVLGCVSILVLTFSHYPCILKMHPFHSVCMLLVSSSLGLELHIYLSTSPVWTPRLPSIPCYINMLWQWSP